MGIGMLMPVVGAVAGMIFGGGLGSLFGADDDSAPPQSPPAAETSLSGLPGLSTLSGPLTGILGQAFSGEGPLAGISPLGSLTDLLEGGGGNPLTSLAGGLLPMLTGGNSPASNPATAGTAYCSLGQAASDVAPATAATANPPGIPGPEIREFVPPSRRGGNPFEPAAPADPSFAWTTGAPMPTARNEVAATSVGTKIYVFGGNIGGGTTVPAVEIYDTTTNTWSSGPDMPGGRNHAKAVVVGNVIYVLGGFSGNYLNYEYHNDVFAFDTTTQSWSLRNPMPVALGAYGADAIGGRIFITGGLTPEGISSQTYVYDPNNDSWSTAAPLPTPREHLTATAYNGRLYTFGGRQALIFKVFKNLDNVEIFDPTANAWSQCAPLPTARSGSGSSVFGNKIVVVGGESLLSTNAETEAYTPARGSWESLADMPTGRHGIGVASLRNRYFVIGGGDSAGITMQATNVNEILEAR